MLLLLLLLVSAHDALFSCYLADKSRQREQWTQKPESDLLLLLFESERERESTHT